MVLFDPVGRRRLLRFGPDVAVDIFAVAAQ